MIFLMQTFLYKRFPPKKFFSWGFGCGSIDSVPDSQVRDMWINSRMALLIHVSDISVMR